jgi:hypothetical protein
LVTAACLLLGGTPLQVTRAATLDDLLNGASLVVGDVSMHSWELVALNVTAPVGPDLTLIQVNPLNDDPLNPGFELSGNGQLATAGFDSIDLTFRFTVSPTAPGTFINGNTLDLTGTSFSSQSGIVMVSELVSDLGANELASELVFADNSIPFFLLSDAASFPAQPGVVIEKNLFIMGLSPSDTVGLDAFEQRFALVPEPASALLFLAALHVIIVPRRGRR